MTKHFLMIIAFSWLQFAAAQCPVINGALINACAADGVTEGINEFVYFTTASQGAVSLYKFSYGSRNPPASQTPTGILSGLDATTKTGPGSVFVLPGNTLTEVTASSTVIPAGSSVVFIPSSLDQVYDFTNLCKNNRVYVVYININAATAIATKWMAGGTMANAATTPRYLQMEFNGNACTANVRSYDAGLWPNPGNTPPAEGNALAWNERDSTLYLNNGCSVIVTPVRLISFRAEQMQRTVTLTWQTASSINSSHFEIERSSNGRDFLPIGTLPIAGNSSELRQYQFVDASSIATTTYYRLKIFESNGSYTYSPVAIVRSKQTAALAIFPSVATNKIAIQYSGIKADNYNLVVLDQTGRSIHSQLVRIPGNPGQLMIDVSAFAAGVYTLSMSNQTDVHVQRFVKL